MHSLHAPRHTDAPCIQGTHNGTPDAATAAILPACPPPPPQGAFAAACNGLLLARSLRQRLWASSARTAKQLPNIGKLMGERLAAAGLGGLRELEAADPRRIETVLQRCVGRIHCMPSSTQPPMLCCVLALGGGAALCCLLPSALWPCA